MTMNQMVRNFSMYIPTYLNFSESDEITTTEKEPISTTTVTAKTKETTGK